MARTRLSGSRSPDRPSGSLRASAPARSNSERYADAATRFVGPPTISRLRSRAVLDPEVARAVILMGPNARHVDPTSLDVGPDPLAVTFDMNVLFARKPERKS